MKPYVPHVQVTASRDRATRLAQSGEWTDRKVAILSMVFDACMHGLTWKEIADRTGLHHGQVSAVLSVLHRDGMVFALETTRQRCHPYVHAQWRDEFAAEVRRDTPARTKAGELREQIEQRDRLLDEMRRQWAVVEAYAFEHLPTLGECNAGFPAAVFAMSTVMKHGID